MRDELFGQVDVCLGLANAQNQGLPANYRDGFVLFAAVIPGGAAAMRLYGSVWVRPETCFSKKVVSFEWETRNG